MPSTYYRYYRLFIVWAALLLWGAAPYASHGQSATWMQAVPGTLSQPYGAVSFRASTTDAAGNVYVTGTFIGGVQFGSYYLAASGYYWDNAAFVAKWNSATGAWAWAYQGGPADGNGIAVSGTSVYIVGNTLTSSGATPVNFGNINLPGAGSHEAFIAKYTDNGTSATLRWAYSAGGTGIDIGMGVATNGSSVYVTGLIDNNSSNAKAVNFNGITLNGATATISYDVFLAKYNDLGSSASVVWARSGGGTNPDTGYDVAVNGNRIYVGGRIFNNNTNSFGVNFSGLTVNGGSSTSSEDAFVVKYTDNGTTATPVWGYGGGGISADNGCDVAVSGNNVYLTGRIFNNANNDQRVNFSGVAVPGAVNGLTSDAFVVKYVDAGASASAAWGYSGGGYGSDCGYGLGVSGSSVYLTGTIENNSSNAKKVSFSGTVLKGASSTISDDLFVVKYGDAGASASVAWATSGGSPSDDQTWGTNTGPIQKDTRCDLAVSGSNIYVVSRVPSMRGVYGQTAPLADTYGGGLLAQLDPATGTWQALRHADEGGTMTVSATTTDASGNVFVAGYFSGRVKIGTTVLTTSETGNTLYSGYQDTFVAKWSSTTGQWVWAYSGGGINNDAALGIAVNGTSVYLTGYTYNTSTNVNGVYFGNVALKGSTTTASYDVFLVKYTDAGTSASVVWTRSAGGTGADYGYGLAANGNLVYLTGSYTNTAANTNAVTFNGTALPGTGTSANTDVFLARYTDNGSTPSFGWVAGDGGTGADAGTKVAVSGTSVYVTGYVTNKASNGNAVTFGSVNLTGIGSTTNTDVFLAKYTDAGTSASVTWAADGGGIGTDQARDLAVSGANVYLTGLITNNSANANAVNFGGTPLPGASVTVSSDVFVAKYVDGGATRSLAWATSGGGTSDDYGYGIAVSGTGVYISGSFDNTIANANSVSFGGITLKGKAISLQTDLFVVKYNDAGASVGVAWATSGGSPTTTSYYNYNDDIGKSLSVFGKRIFMVGVSSLPATYGTIALTGNTAASVLLAAELQETPALTSFSPGTGVAGTSVTITGQNFIGATAVTFNGVAAASFTVNSDTEIVAVVSAAAGTGKVSVTTAAGTIASTGTFTVGPNITGFTPAQGAPGSVVLVQGYNFTSTTTVAFNGINAVKTYNSANQITATVPASATTGPVTVSNATGTTTSATPFTITSGLYPKITSFTPTANVIVGTVMMIIGQNFTGATLVRFNNQNATTFTVNSATSITATVPAGATTGKVYVANPSGLGQSTGTLTIVQPPTITTLAPTSGGVGAFVLITGTNLTGATSVKFGTLNAASFTVNSATQIAAKVPTGATNGKISVTTIAGTAQSATNFTILPGTAPTITSLSPTTGIRGSTVIVNGTGFTGVTSIKLGAVAVTAGTGYTVNSATKITLTVPNTAITGRVYVTTSGGGMTQSPTDYTVILAPTISSFTPASANAGATVTINGTNFTNISAVKFGGVAASGFTMVSTARITATVPAGAVTGTLTVTNPAGTATSAGTFTYLGPRPAGRPLAAAPDAELSLWPNPARETVQLAGVTGSTVILFDALGRTVATAAVTEGTATLDVRHLPAGVYTVRAEAVTRRLVVSE